MSWLLAVHVSCVVLTIAGFVLRGIWMIRNSPLLGARWVRVVPHVVDTVLLAAGIALAIHIRQYPFVNAWLTAKTLGLIVYIGLGAVALRHGRTRRVRIAAWIGALFAAGYIVTVAVTRNPLPAVARSQVFALPPQHSLRQKTPATADPLPSAGSDGVRLCARDPGGRSPDPQSVPAGMPVHARAFYAHSERKPDMEVIAMSVEEPAAAARAATGTTAQRR